MLHQCAFLSICLLHAFDTTHDPFRKFLIGILHRELTDFENSLARVAVDDAQAVFEVFEFYFAKGLNRPIRSY